MENTQIVKMDESVIEFLGMLLNFDNQGDQYKEVTTKEIRREIEKSLNVGNIKNKKVVWTRD